MSKFMTALPLCAALALTAPITVFAQTATDTTTSETAAPETAAEESGTQAEEPKPQPGTSGNAGQIEEQLSLGEDADKDPELGKPYTKKEIGSWEMRCIKTEEEVDPCQMYQLLADGEGAPVAEVSLFRLPGGGQAKAGATVVVPLETALPAQLTLSVDGGKARRYPYAFCNPVGCYVRMGLTDADIAAFKRGKQAVLTIVPALAPDQEVKLTLSLDGFTAGYDEVSVIEQ
ncbi:invasion associated locus B family protein [Sulfitobacter sp. W027]|jgi:invasion protein IalB|uniref:invasion associated locus B family protein n=1 Tax=Sulfitobacter sp. W027 TaxID=2867025 RepID=UPI0021A5B019|nr:invasion associated locus B family protein [Sulfitobacter sp. W027]UWR35005.1 invasion associated locus B family protein [Sulfitobacter sp. W027]